MNNALINMTATCPTTTLTMSSLEMVDYINAMRQPGEAELTYGNFMAKVPKVLGESTAYKFSEAVQYSSGNGATSTRNIYNFPKREACLMAMSYSYDLQAKVFDRMTALEAALNAPAMPADYGDALILAGEKHKALQIASRALEAATLQITVDAPKVMIYDAVIAQKHMTITDFAKRALRGVNTSCTKRDLAGLGFLFRQGKGYEVYSKYREVLFNMSAREIHGQREITILAKGKELLIRLHAEGKLTMKVSHKPDAR